MRSDIFEFRHREALPQSSLIGAVNNSYSWGLNATQLVDSFKSIFISLLKSPLQSDVEKFTDMIAALLVFIGLGQLLTLIKPQLAVSASFWIK